MAGELVPLVMIPRYSTYATAPLVSTALATIGMDVTDYQSVILNVWRGWILGGGGTVTTTFTVTCQESTDQQNWTTCGGSLATGVVTENAERQFNATLSKKWFRLKIELAGDAPVVTCWAVGFLEDRLK